MILNLHSTILIPELRCKGTTKNLFPQEGTLGWDSFLEVTIAVEWEKEKTGVNLD